MCCRGRLSYQPYSGAGGGGRGAAGRVDGVSVGKREVCAKVSSALWSESRATQNRARRAKYMGSRKPAQGCSPGAGC